MFQPSWRVPSRSVHSWRVHSWSVSSMLARFLRAALLAHQLLLASEPLTPLRNVGRKNTRETVVRCLSAFCSNPSLLSAWCAASPLSLRTAHSSPRGALPLRFLCEPLTPLRVQLFPLFPPHSRLLSTEESLASGRRKPWLLVPAKMPATLCGGGHSARHSCAAWTRTHSAARTRLEKTKFLQRGELLHLGAGKREVRPQL